MEMNDLRAGGDDDGFESIGGEEVEQAKRDVAADSTGLGRFLLSGVSGAVGAVASLGGFGQKRGPEGTREASKEEDTTEVVVSREPLPHKQTTGEADPLDVAFQHSADLQHRNTELTKRLSNVERKKKQEIDDLTIHLKELQHAVTLLSKDIEKKDKKIAEMKMLVQKLSDKKRDGSSELARALHEKDAEIEELTQLLRTEKGKLVVTSTEVKEKQKESEEYKKQTHELSNELKKAKCELGDAFMDITFDTDCVRHPGVTHDTTDMPQDEELSEAMQSEPTESPGESVALKKVHELQEALQEKETQLANLENQLKEYEAKVLEMEQVRDHSKSQSKAMLVVKQELDATMMSHDELVQYIDSMERQVADTETHCRKLEAQLNGARQDYNIAQQALRDTKGGLEADLERVRETLSKVVTTKNSLENQLLQAKESVDNLSVEKESFLQERTVLKQEIVDLHDKLAIVTAEAEIYKEDFENEREDRGKAHDLKEEMRFACDAKVHAMAKERHAFEETIQNLTRKLEGLSNEKEGLQKKQEIRATRTSTRHEVQQKDKQILELQNELYEARQKAITAQEEVQEKTAQVKQYKKKDDQREEKLINLDARNQGLVQEMERVRSELEKMSKSEAHDELLKVQMDNNVSVKQDTPQRKSSDSGDPTALPRPDPSNQQQSVAQQPPTIPNVNTVPPATLDNYKQQPEARCVPNSPTEGHPSMNSDNPIVEVNGFRNATAQNERQSSTGPQSDNGIRYPPSLKVKQSHSSAPSSTNFALSEQAASPTDSNKMALVLGEKQLEIPPKMPSGFNQSDYPPANTHQDGGYQDPVNNFQGQSGFDNLPQGHYQNQPQPRNVPPSNHPSQWPNQQPYLQDHLYQQQPGTQYEQPRSPHYNPQQQNYGQSNYNQQHGNVQQQGPHWCNHGRQDQWENQHYQGAGQQAYNYPSDGLQHNTQNPSYPMPSNLRDDDAHSPVLLNNHNSLSENASNSPSNISSQPYSNEYGVDVSPIKPKPKPRAHCKPDTPSPVSNLQVEEQLNPNRTELLVKPNVLQEGIDRDIAETAAAVSHVTMEGEREGAPLDPNLICPMCMKQYRIGEIQLYRAHVNKCDGTRH